MKRFACSHCDKAFSRRDYLERHSANHLTIKPYVCEPCNRSFARSDLYENHLITKFHLKRATNAAVSSASSSSTTATQRNPIAIANGVRRPHQHQQQPKSRHTSPPLIPPPFERDRHQQQQQQPQERSHSWLFVDGREDWGSKHYDQIYSQYCEKVNTVPTIKRSMVSLASSIMINNQQSRSISHLLGVSEMLPLQVSEYIDICWSYALCNPEIFIHRPTFHTQSQNNMLLAAMTLVGKYCMHDNQNSVRHSLDTLIESFNQIQIDGVWDLQTFALLKWLQYQIPQPATTACLKHSRKVLNCLGSLTLTSQSDNSWLNWIQSESKKRTVYFIVYLDFIFASSDPLCILDLDINMPQPEELWETRSSTEFFDLVGHHPLKDVPYLYVVRSMLRLPKLGDNNNNNNNNSTQSTKNNSSWSQLSLTMILYGLLDLARVSSDSGSLARLSRGLQIWKGYFDAAAANADSTERIHKPTAVEPIFKNTSTNIQLLKMQYNAAHILMHEDIELIKNVAASLPSWLNSSSKDISTLLDTDRYSRWFKTNEARDATSVASMFLLQALSTQSATSLLNQVTLYCVLIVWMYESLNNDDTTNSTPSSPLHCYASAMNTKQDAEQFLSQMLSRTCNSTTLATPPATPPPLIDEYNHKISSVVAIGSDLLKSANNQQQNEHIHILDQLLAKCT